MSWSPTTRVSWTFWFFTGFYFLTGGSAVVFKLPFIGWNMLLNGDIKLCRGDKDSIAAMMDRCEALLKENISISIFPEGTRSKDGRLGSFKPGAFILAKNAKVPIQPIVLNHTRNALPKHSLTIRGQHEMEVTVLDEVPYDRFKDMAPLEIGEMIRGIIGAHVHEMVCDDADEPLPRDAVLPSQ